ncbi:MAG: hypothetical protein IJF92_05665 [Bacilli bacterium]|nr:hypothetical protein [Bacilli bacterium]
MKKLPKIYQNNINKNINNNKRITYVNNKDNIFSVKNTLDKIFTGVGYSYNIPVIIETNDKVYDTSIVTRTKRNIFTLDNDVIKIEDINNIIIK